MWPGPLRAAKEDDRTAGGRPPSIPWPALGAITAVAVVLRLYRLEAQPLWLDEAYTWDAARIVQQEGPLAVATFDHIAPMYYWLAAASMALGDATAWWLRLPSALAGAAAVPALWWATRRVLGQDRMALGAAWALAISPFALWYSQEARAYTLVILLACGYVGLCWPLQGWGAQVPGRAISRQHWLTLLGVTILAMWTHHVFVFLIGSWGVFMLLRRGWRSRTVWTWAATQVVAVLAFFPWLVLTAGRLDRSVGAKKPDSLVWVPYTYLNFLTGQSFGPSNRELRTQGAIGALQDHAVPMLLAGFAGALMLIVALCRVRAVSRPGTAWVACWAVLPVAFLLLATSTAHIGYNPRYAITAFPAIAVLAGIAFGQANRGAVQAGTAALLFLLLCWGVIGWYADARYAKDDLRSAQQTLVTVLRQDDVLVIGNSSAIPPLEAYGFTCPERAFVVRDERAATALSRGRRTRGRTFVLQNRQWEVLPAGMLASATEPLGPPTRTWHWPGVELTEHPFGVVPAVGSGLEAGCGR